MIKGTLRCCDFLKNLKILKNRKNQRSKKIEIFRFFRFFDFLLLSFLKIATSQSTLKGSKKIELKSILSDRHSQEYPALRDDFPNSQKSIYRKIWLKYYLLVLALKESNY